MKMGLSDVVGYDVETGGASSLVWFDRPSLLALAMELIALLLGPLMSKPTNE